MSWTDYVKGINITGSRAASTSAEGRLINAIKRQIKVSNGETITVANQELKSWWSDGVATWKVANFTLGKFKCTEDEHKESLQSVLDAIFDGTAKDMVEDLDKRLKERAEKKNKE